MLPNIKDSRRRRNKHRKLKYASKSVFHDFEEEEIGS
jgi:hypothetical protein